MNSLLKKNKIIDSFLFYDEIELLKFRLSELYDNVDYFFILESDHDFKGNPKELFFEKNKIFFQEWMSKIIYIPLLKEHYNEELSQKKQIEIYQKLILLKSRELKLGFEDIIFFSDVDEIPSFEDFDLITKYLMFEPVLFLQKNFLWTTKYYNPTTHLGTFCFTFSHFLMDNDLPLKNYFDKNEIYSQNYKIIEGGYHFSHFYSKDRIVNKLNLIGNEIYNISDISYLQNNLTPKKDSNIFLRDYEGNLPINFNLIPHQQFNERDVKKFVVVLNFNRNKVDESYFNEYEKIINVNFLSIYDLENESFVSDKIKNYNVFIPKKYYYDSVKFELEFGINEIKSILKNYFPLNKDIFHFITFDFEITDGKSILWQDIKDNHLFDLLKNFLIKNPSE